MSRDIGFSHDGRVLEVRALVISGDWQIWFFEHGQRIFLHSVVPIEHAVGIEASDYDAVQAAMIQAQCDVECHAIRLPFKALPKQR